MTTFARIVHAVALALFVTSAIAVAETSDVVRVHGHVLAVPSPDTVIAAIDAIPGSPAQTRRFHVNGAKVRSGEEFAASLDLAKSTLASIHEIVPLATPPPHLVTNGSAQSNVLDSVVFILGVLILGGLLAWITKRVIIDERH